MEIHFKLTYKLPKEVIKTFGITDDTPLEAYCENGVLHIRELTEDEIRELHESADADYEEGYDEGFEEGYAEAQWEQNHPDECEDEEDGNDLDEDEDECSGDDCDCCEYYCHHCRKCVLDEESEDTDHE